MNDYRTFCGLYFSRREIKLAQQENMRDAIIAAVGKVVPRGD